MVLIQEEVYHTCCVHPTQKLQMKPVFLKNRDLGEKTWERLVLNMVIAVRVLHAQQWRNAYNGTLDCEYGGMRRNGKID